MATYFIVFKVKQLLYSSFTQRISECNLWALFTCSMCRDCVELSVEIIYSGTEFEYPRGHRNPVEQFKDLQQFIRESIYPHLNWMTSLTSLVLIKLGDFQTADEPFGFVRSFMLDDLCSWLFCVERAPSSLRHLWIQDFCFDLDRTTGSASAQSFISYQIGDTSEMYEQEPFHGFPKLEYIAKMEFSEPCSLLHLPNLKYAHGSCYYESEPVRYISLIFFKLSILIFSDFLDS